MPRLPRFHFYQDRAQQWRWNLRGANGLKLCDSGESFPTKYHAKRNARRTKAATARAAV